MGAGWTLALFVASLLASIAPASSAQAGPWSGAAIASPYDFAMSVSPADVDGDGDLDVFTGARMDPVGWSENTAGDGTVWVGHLVSSLNDVFSVRGADLDGDGDLDVATGATGSSAVAWHENTVGDGSSWSIHRVTLGTFTVRSLQSGDMDLDGDLDLVYGLELSGEVAWQENVLGNGSSWNPHLIDAAASVLAIDLADVNEDGRLDVLAASFQDDRVLLYEQPTGGAEWVPAVISTTSDGPHGVSAADLDGDGDLDVAAAGFLDSEVVWYERHAPGSSTWTEHFIRSSGGQFHALSTVDLDRDGDVDVLTASFDIGDSPPFTPVVWYENKNGDGVDWTERPLPTAPDKAREVAAADLDGDCDLDLVYAGSMGDTVTWLRNLAERVDCNENGIGDSCEIGAGTVADCNGNGVPDECDLRLGTSRDDFALTSALTLPGFVVLLHVPNGVPDECELPLPAKEILFFTADEELATSAIPLLGTLPELEVVTVSAADLASLQAE